MVLHWWVIVENMLQTCPHNIPILFSGIFTFNFVCVCVCQTSTVLGLTALSDFTCNDEQPSVLRALRSAVLHRGSDS